jgi:sugar lactone lactonase YvrE
MASVVLAAVLCAGCSMMKQDTPRAKAGPNLNDAQLARSADSNIPSSGNIETVAMFKGPMPTGVCVSRTGRIFVCFPRWGDPVEYTVGEVRNGRVEPYPNLETNRLNVNSQTECFVSVQSVVIDPQDRLWMLDTGSINMQPTKPGGPKLICYDLKTDRMIKRINFPENVALPTTYLNDVRFSLAMGREGIAFITDSSDSGPNGIIVVDLASGTSWRKLNDHPSTKADQNFIPIVEGQELKARPGAGKREAYLKIGSDGIAISNDGKTLFYCPLASRKVLSVSTEALADGKMSDAETAKSVRDLGTRDFASDGLHTDQRGNLLLTDYEHNAIRRRPSQDEQNAKYEIVAQDPRMIWPDTMDVTTDGWVYFICNQLNRQAKFHDGKDQRKPPYVLFRTKLPDEQQRMAEAQRGR